MRLGWPYALAVALMFAAAPAALAETEGEFDGLCTMGLA